MKPMLEPRLQNVLKRNGLTLEQAERMSDEQLLSLNHMGASTVRYLRARSRPAELAALLSKQFNPASLPREPVEAKLERRLTGVLKCEGLTREQANAMTDEELARIPNCGPGTIRYLRQASRSGIGRPNRL